MRKQASYEAKAAQTPEPPSGKALNTNVNQEGHMQHADVHALHVEGERGKQNTHRLPFSSCLIYKTFAFLHCYIHSVRYQLPNIYLNLIRALLDVSSNMS